MSSDARQVLGSTLVIAGSFIPGPVGIGLQISGAALLYSGGKSAAKEAEKEARFRARQQASSRNIKGNIRGSSETHLVCFGKVRVGGVVVALGSGRTGTLDIGLAHSICHAGGCEGVARIWVNDDVIAASEYSGDPLTADALVTKAKYVYTSGTPTDAVAFRHYRGTGTQDADATLTTRLGTAGGGGTTAYRRGIAWTRFTLERSTDDPEGFEKAFPTGIPTLSVELKGVRCYDPRLDTTEGGSGGQRHSDPLTWTWTQNSALIAATYMIMEVSDGGMGVATNRLDWSSVAAAANICDETLTIDAGSPTVFQPRYRCNIALDTADSRETNLRKILDTMQGQRVRIGEKYKLYAGAYRSPTFTLDETYLRGGVTIQTRSDLDALYNAVRIVHDDEDQNFRDVEAPPFTSSAYETQDGGERLWREESLSGVSNTYQAQYIAAVMGAMSRKQKIIECPCNLKALDIEGWETGYVSIAELGISSAVYRVISWEWDGEGPRLILREEAEDVWDVPGFAASTSVTATAVDYETPPTPAGLSATAVTDGIVLKWTSPSPSTYTIIEIHRSDGASSPSVYTQIGSAVGFSFTDPVTDGSTYDYKIRGRNAQGDTGEFSSNAIATAKTIPTIASPASGFPVYDDFNTAENQHELNAVTPGDGISIEQDETTGVLTFSADVVEKDSLRLRADFSSTSATLADVTGFKFQLAENSVYEVELTGLVQSAATSTGFKVGATAPAGTALMTLLLHAPDTAASTTGLHSFATGTTAVSATTANMPAATTIYPFVATFTIVTGAETGSPSTGFVGDFQIQFATEVGGSSATLEQYSLMVLSKIDAQTSAATVTLQAPGFGAAYTSQDTDDAGDGFVAARLELTYLTDGTWTLVGGSGDTITGSPTSGNWGTPTTAGVGSDYEMRFTVTNHNGVGTITNPASSWTTINSNLVFRLTVNSTGGTIIGNLDVQAEVRQRGTTTPTSDGTTDMTVTAIV